MTKRKRISTKAQRRRRAAWNRIAYFGAFWDSCRPNYWLSYEIYWTYTYNDNTRQMESMPIKPYVTSLHDRVYIPYVHVRLAFDRAMQTVKGLPFYQAVAQLKTANLRELLADKFQEYQAVQHG